MIRGVVVDADGVEWWSTEYACAQLGVTPARLRDWARRSRRSPRFPQVDPPRREGNTAAYRAEQLLDAELRTAESSRGRRRGRPLRAAHCCTCPDIDVTTLCQLPGSQTMKGRDSACPAHGDTRGAGAA